MSLVDSLDSILMLYAYAQPELRVAGRWRIIEKNPEHVFSHSYEGGGEEREGYGDEGAERVRDQADRVETAEGVVIIGAERERSDSYADIEGMEPQLPAEGPSSLESAPKDDSKPTDVKITITPDTPSAGADPFASPASPATPRASSPKPGPAAAHEPHPNPELMHAKTATMSSLSISLTLLSIAVALAISLIEIMGLIGEQCGPCSEAAENDPGLAGSWWRAWARANDASGYVGAAIVGCFVAILLIYHGVRWGVKRHRRQAIQV